jgi:hypothetical protein
MSIKRNLLIVLLLFLGFFNYSVKIRGKPKNNFIDWEKLKNPVYEHEGWSTKDACMIYKGGYFYIFFSAFYYDRGRERSHVVGIKTKDFLNFSEPMFIWDGRDDGWVGMCSPNITKVDSIYYLTYNSWGDDHSNGMPNQLFYATSKNLEDWDKHQPLARDVTVEDGELQRAIDAAATRANEKFYLAWKAEQTPQIAVCDSLAESGWKTLGRPTDKWFENAEFIKIDDKWHLLATAHGDEDHIPALSAMIGKGDEDSDWLNWGAFYFFDIPLESFNTDNRANASFLADWRDHDGYYYLLYAGRTHDNSHAGRGNNKLGLARTRDLVKWYIPPEGIVKIVDNNHTMPSNFGAAYNYPNPFNSKTTIEFTIPEQKNVILTVYNLEGYKVEELLNRSKKAGTHRIDWLPADRPSGLYLYKIEAGEYSYIRKMLFVK